MAAPTLPVNSANVRRLLTIWETARLKRSPPVGATTDVFPALGLFARTRADRGAEITEVARQGLAELSGLHVGYVINSVDGKEVRTPMELAVLVSDRAPGPRIRVGYTFHSSVSEFQTEKVIILQDHLKQN